MLEPQSVAASALSKRGSMTDQTKATGTLKLIREASEAKLQPRGVP
jgi:hypothetical protein